MEGLYLQIYPSDLASASRMAKIGRSAQSELHFEATHLVGMRSKSLPDDEEIASGVHIRRLGPGGMSSRYGRALRVLAWYLSVLRTYWRSPVAIVAAHKVWTLPLCRLLALLTRARLVYNCHELETEAHGMTGFRKRLAKAVEARSIRACAVVSVVNQPIAEWYADQYGIKPVVVGNVPTISPSDSVSIDLRSRFRVPSSELLFVHTGHLIEVRNIPLILQVFASSRHHVVFLGDGHAMEPHVKEMVISATEEHENIHWLPAIPHDLIVDTIRSADIGLCLIEGQVDLSDHLSSPNKLFEYLAARLPPLCSDLPIARAELGDLAETWIVKDPARELAAVVQGISRADVDRFRESWQGLSTWDQEVADLLTAYRSLRPHTQVRRA